MKNQAKVVAGRFGGAARMRLYGNPGTAEGRRLGGLRSQETHKRNHTGFKTLRILKTPRKSKELAELMGILAGDGHVGTYQISVVTNSETDYEHALYIKTLLGKMFAVPVSLTRHKTDKAAIILVSSKHACRIVNALGMKSGNKVTQQIQPPTWILKNSNYAKAYLRGLIDTDGTAYIDRHIVKGKSYTSICLAFTNASVPLLDFVEETWKGIGYHPTRWGRHVRLRRRKDVLGHIQTVGFSNPKHKRRIGI